MLLIIFSGLISSLISVTISIRYYQWNENRRVKLQVLYNLFGNRHVLIENRNYSDKEAQLFIEALNQVFVVFYDSDEVLATLKAFHEVVTAPQKADDSIRIQKLLDLFKAMCKNLKINSKFLSDNFFLQPFDIKK